MSNHTRFVRFVLVFYVLLGFTSACQLVQLEAAAIPPDPISDTPSPTATDNPTFTPTLTPTNTPIPLVRLGAVGDLMLARTISDRILADGPQTIFNGVQPVFDLADILVGNLECAITEGGQRQVKGYTFRAIPLSAQTLKSAGFDLLNLANNHVLDYGVEGLTDTQFYLEQNGILPVGVGLNNSLARAPAMLERQGLRFAFLGYVDVPVEVRGFDTQTWIATDSHPGLAWAYPEDITADVMAARSNADFVVVFLHSGYEGVLEPNNIQHQAAHAAIDAGAALVIGSHPHVLQPVEWYNGGLIAYSLGNFVFDDFNEEQNRTAIMFVTFSPDGIQNLEWIPVLIDDGLPYLAGGEDARIILDMVSP